MLGRSSRLPDAADVRFLAAAIRLGVISTLAICATGALYYAQTWDRPNRPALMAMALGFGLGALVLLPVRTTRLVQGRWRDTFFLGWSALSTAGMALCVYLDGGRATPLTYGLVLPLAFAALVYPTRGAVAVAVLDVAAYLVVALLRPHEAGELSFIVAALVCTGSMCVWTAWWRERQRVELGRLSRTDPLTGCLNRRGLEAAVDDAVAAGSPFALMTLDLDDFKTVNDRDGHAGGDAVLCAAVRRLHDAVRPTDAIGRLGGDEFAVLLPGASPEVARRVLERATLALSTTAPASFGVAAFPADGATGDALFLHADAAVYRAKAARSGRAYPASGAAA